MTGHTFAPVIGSSKDPVSQFPVFGVFVLRKACSFTPDIIGDKTVCANEPQTYSVAETPGSTYTWTVTGGNIITGQGTNKVSVIWNNGIMGTINVVQITP